MTGAETHYYKFDLKKGEFFQVHIKQRGIDVILSLYLPDNKLLVQHDAPNSAEGAEELSIVAPIDGKYRIEVSSFDEKAALGKYTIQIEKPRQPNEKDLQRVKAEQIFSDAMLLHLKEDKESRLSAEAKFLESVPLWKVVGAKYWQALALLNAGYLESNFAEKKVDAIKALQNFTDAQNIFHELSETHFEQSSLLAIANLDDKFEDYQKAVENYEKSAALAKSLGDTKSEAFLQSQISLSYFNLKKYDQAISANKKSLEINKKLNNTAAVAILLNRIGLSYSRLEKRDEAIGFYLQAAAAAHANNDQVLETQALYNAGFDYELLKNFPKALENFQAALTLQRPLADKSYVADTLNEIISVYKAQKDDAKTQAAYDELLTFYRDTKNQSGEADTLNKTGIFQAGLKNYQKAIELQTSSLALYRELKNQPMTATLLGNLAIDYKNLKDTKNSADFYRQEIEVLKQNGSPKEVAATLENLAGLYYDSKKLNEAVSAMQEAATVYAQLKDEKQMARMINRIGVYYSDSKEYAKADEYFQQALPIFRRLKNREYEAKLLRNIGSVYVDSERQPEGIEFLQNALTIYRELNNFKSDEAEILTALGSVYVDVEQNKKAIESYNAALVLYHDLKEPNHEAQTRNGIAVAFENTGDFQKSLEQYRLALPIYREAKNREGEMVCLINIGKMLQTLGSTDKAIENYKSANAIAVVLGDKDHQFQTLDYLGNLTSGEESLGYYNQAKDIAIATKNYRQAAEVLNSMSIELSGSDNPETLTLALKFFEASLSLSRGISNRSIQFTALQGIAKIYYKQGDYQKSFEYLQKGLPLLDNDIRGEINLTGNFMYLLKKQGNERLAILYGKQSINLSQKVRANIKGLDKDIQQSFLKSNENKYRMLADLLISQGRISEAEQVLGMLKEEEASTYLRRDDKVARGLLLSVSLSEKERDAIKRYDDFADNTTALAKEYGDLDQKRAKYEDGKFPKQERYNELRVQIADANTAFQKFLDELKITFGKHDERVTTVDSSLQNTLKRLKESKTAVVSTIVGEDRLSLIVTTGGAQRAHRIDISEKAVNALVAEFRQALTNPKLDPRPAGQKLYDILIKPIEADLNGIGADTILWSLDGTLRYLPTAAFWDKEKGYVAERYSSVVLTLASRDTLGLPVVGKENWNALGVGVSRATEGFDALKAVPDELDCIVTDSLVPGVSAKPVCRSGVMNGKKLLNDKFTLAAFESSLGRYPIVHIASHFSLNPGNDKDSFLLLGGGDQRRFTVEELRSVSLTDVEMIVLSACNTATPGGEKTNGVEIEGFGAAAQKQGAKAVLASLWSVADDSTREWMVKFYTTYAKPDINKAESVRLAQVAMMHGKYTAAERNTRRDGFTINDNTKPTFPPDPNAPYAHPYYWSPFVLFGNWK